MEFSQRLAFGQHGEAAIGDIGSLETQFLQLGQPREMIQGDVGDSGQLRYRPVNAVSSASAAEPSSPTCVFSIQRSLSFGRCLKYA